MKTIIILAAMVATETVIRITSNTCRTKGLQGSKGERGERG